MISPADIQVTKHDLTLFATIMVVSNLVENQLLNTPLFSESWMNLTVATLLGVALHGLLTNKVSSFASKQLKIKQTGVVESVYDLVKFGTIFASQRAIVNMIEGRPVVFDRTWLMVHGSIIAGYALFNVAVKGTLMKAVGRVGRLGATARNTVHDLIKVSMGALLANVVVDGTVTKTHLMLLAATLAGFVAFHFGTKVLVLGGERTPKSPKTPKTPESVEKMADECDEGEEYDSESEKCVAKQ